MSGLVTGIAASAVAKGATGFLSAIPKPVWEALAVIGYVFALLDLHQHYAHAAINAAKAEQQAADDKVLQRSLANEVTLRAAIAKQNAAVADLAAQSKAQQQQAAKASEAAQERAQAAEAVAARLRASAAQRPSGGDCGVSKALQEQWQ